MQAELEARLYQAERDLARFKELRRLDMLSGQYDQEAGEAELAELQDAVDQAEAALSEWMQPYPPIETLVQATSNPEYRRMK